MATFARRPVLHSSLAVAAAGTPEAATDAAFKKIEAILAKYPIAQS
jgi:hypothetical protein